MSVLDWLLAPQQKLLGVVAGAVYADASGALGSLRQALAWYPDQLWHCQWGRLAQEEAFVVRTAEVGDETGSAVTAARLVRDMMRLALMIQRRYGPYQKWLGTAFAPGHHGDGLPEHVTKAIHARDVTARESTLAKAYTALARRHNAAAHRHRSDAARTTAHRRGRSGRGQHRRVGTRGVAAVLPPSTPSAARPRRIGISRTAPLESAKGFA
jgi:hypothetical protein